MESTTTAVRLIEAIRLSSIEHAVGSVLLLSPAEAAQLIGAGHAVAAPVAPVAPITPARWNSTSKE